MFKDRKEAGIKLLEKLKEDLLPETIKNSIVLAIPRGGIVVGKEISNGLEIPMDNLVVKKIPAPESEELAIGAVSDGGTVVWENDLIKRLGVEKTYLDKAVKEKVKELETKKDFFRKDRPPLDLKGKTVLLVDDGIATGATIKVGIQVLRSFLPKEIIVAVPVVPKEFLEEIKQIADGFVYLEAPEMFFSVGQFYENFEPVSDEEVERLL